MDVVCSKQDEPAIEIFVEEVISRWPKGARHYCVKAECKVAKARLVKEMTEGENKEKIVPRNCENGLSLP